MYIFRSDPIDCFYGMISLSNYIIGSVMAKEQGKFYPVARELHSFLVRAFVKMKTLKTGWAGDITEIWVSSIPKVNPEKPDMIIAFKQSDKGTSFIISECDLGVLYDNLYEIKVCENYSQDDLFNFLDKSYVLIDELFEKALERIKKVTFDEEENCSAVYTDEVVKDNDLKKFNIHEFDQIG